MQGLRKESVLVAIGEKLHITAEDTATYSLLLLLGLTCIISLPLTKQVLRLLKPSSAATFSVSLSGERTRSAFLIFLWIAALARGASLIWILYNNDALINSQNQENLMPTDRSIDWAYAVALAIPSICFLSTYSIVIHFCAQIYYTSRFMVLNHLRSSYWFLNIGIYTIFFVIAAITRLLDAYSELGHYLNMMLGALFILAAGAMGFFGVKVAFQFSGDATDRVQSARRSAIIRRVLLLSLTCPTLFILRGIYNFSITLNLLPIRGLYEGQYMITWDTAIIFLSEWCPVMLVLIVFWPPNSVDSATSRYPTTSNDQSRMSSDNLNRHLLQIDHQRRQQQQHHHNISEAQNASSGAHGYHQNDVLMNFVPNNIYPVGSSEKSRC